MSTSPLSAVGPHWNRRPVLVFAGAFDTRIKTGEDYETRPLASIFHMEPENKPKGEGWAFVPSSYHDFDGREHAVQRAKGEYVALCGDIDKGDLPLERIESLIRGFAQNCAWLIYSSAHSRPGDKRWRVILPLDATVSFGDWHDAQNALFNFLEVGGVPVDRALDRAAQPVYLPNVPEIHTKSGEALRDGRGEPIFYERATTGSNAPGLRLDRGALGAGIDAIRRKRVEDDQAREAMRRDAEARKAARPRSSIEGISIMEGFNRSNSIANLLELYGYTKSPRHSEDWKSGYQEGDSYATRIMGDAWVSLSMSDAAAGVGARCKSGCFGDAYDLYVHYEHKGDHKAAHRQLHAERKAEMPQPDRYSYTSAEEQDFDPETGDPIMDMPDYGDEEPQTEPLPQAPKSPVALPYFWFGDAEPNLDANDFVEGLLTTGAMSVVYGPSNCGKTFFIVDLALHVAWGRDWRGRAIDQGAIVYLSLEGAQGIRNRLAAFRRHHGLDGQNIPFVGMPKPVNLLNDDADVNAVIELVKHVAESTGLHVAMVIVDTLSRAMAGGNENSPEDMTAIVGNCDRIRDATGAHVCIVHHSGKDEAKGARGHSSLRAATDTEIEIKRDPEMTFSSVRVAKQRDLEAAEPFAFTLHSVALGVNRRGKDVTSCIVAEADKSAVIARKPDRLSQKEEEALQSLQMCLTGSSFETETSTKGETVSAVTLLAWQRSMEGMNIIDRDNRDNARSQFSRIKKSLVNKGKIEIGGLYVYMARQTETGSET